MRFGLILFGDGLIKLMFYILDNVEDMICSKCKRLYQVKDKYCFYCYGVYVFFNFVVWIVFCLNMIYDEVIIK